MFEHHKETCPFEPQSMQEATEHSTRDDTCRNQVRQDEAASSKEIINPKIVASFRP